MPPQLARREGGQLLRQRDKLVDKPFRPRTKGQIDALRRTEQVGNAGKIGTLHIAEQQGRATGGDDSSVDLGEFQIGTHRGFDLDDLALIAQQVEVVSEVDHGK